MFSGEFCENSKKEIDLKGIAANDFDLLLNYIYGGTVSINDGNEAYRLLQISNYLCLPSLEDLCVHYLLDNAGIVSLDVAIRIFTFTSLIQRTDLLEKFTERVAENFVTASKFSDLVNITGPSLLGLFSHPNLEHDSSVILDFLTEWMKYASDEDKKMFPTLINNINFEKLPKEWLMKALTVMSSPNLMNASLNENVQKHQKAGL